MSSSSSTTLNSNEISMRSTCPHCGKGFSRKDNVIRHMRFTCLNVKKNKLEPKEQPKHRMEMSAKRKRENIDFSQHKIVCPECNEEISQSCYQPILRTNRQKANACRFLEDGVNIIRSALENRLMSYRAAP
ncbi:hypothetical protein FQA39_LY14723 [Lamprigera yunnana]|nr:hypothetical protein FQA39_LY14723 [Lamprigera yunnana]